MNIIEVVNQAKNNLKRFRRLSCNNWYIVEHKMFFRVDEFGNKYNHHYITELDPEDILAEDWEV